MFKKTSSIPFSEWDLPVIKDEKGMKARPEAPQGLLRKCNHCKSAILAEDVKRNHHQCPKCQGYFRMHAMRRIEMIMDENTFEEWDTGIATANPLGYKGYEEKVEKLKASTNLDEAIITGVGEINGSKTVIGVCDGRFLMASMGYVVGEKITRAIERATKEKLPVVLFACSGGARMQEGMVSLMQMAKTSAALKRHSKAGQLYVSVLTEPTTGGVTASFAMLGDLILAEPGALIGFAGPRVIEQTIGQKLPKGFQRAEFLLEHGFIDEIVKREDMKDTLSVILKLHETKEDKTAYTTMQETIVEAEVTPSIDNAWKRVQLSRTKGRPIGTDYIQELFTDFVECHGDRYYGDDKAVVGGIARFLGKPVTVIVQEKGKSTKDSIEHNFGMPSPEGYRKALRLMKQAEQFNRPVICLVDTPGAFCGIEAEERGQGEAIARNLYEMSDLRVPILSIVIGEGGSGGALALAVADEVWMFENSIYSILSPEGFASILWKDSKRAEEAANHMKLTAEDLAQLGIIDAVIAEPVCYTTENMRCVCDKLLPKITSFINTYATLPKEQLSEHRYNRFRQM